MALQKDRKTNVLRSGDPLSFPVAASTTIYAGGLVATDASGYAVPAAADTTLTVWGIAETGVNNAGAAGQVRVSVKTGAGELIAGDAITIADVGAPCFASDDQTVNKGNGLGTYPPAGIILGVRTAANGDVMVTFAMGASSGGGASPPSGSVVLGDLEVPFGAGATKILTTTAGGGVQGSSGAGAFPYVNTALAAADASIAVNSQKFTGVAAPTATPSPLGTAAKGSSGEVALSDHVHSSTGVRRSLEIAVLQATPVDSTTVLPVGAKVRQCQVVLGTQYSVGATLTVGQVGSLAAFMGAADNTITIGAPGDIDTKIQRTAVSGAGLVVRVTVGGAPAAGTCTVVVDYDIPGA